MGTHPIFESDFDCLTESIVKMLKPIVICADLPDNDPIKMELSNHFQVWNESVYRENSSALGGDINGIILSSNSQKITDLVPTIANLVFVCSVNCPLGDSNESRYIRDPPRYDILT